MPGTDLEEGSRVIDTAVEQRGVAGCKVQRGDRDAVAETTVMVSNGPQREPGVRVRPRSFSSTRTGSRKPIFLRKAFWRSAPT